MTESRAADTQSVSARTAIVRPSTKVNVAASATAAARSAPANNERFGVAPMENVPRTLGRLHGHRVVIKIGRARHSMREQWAQRGRIDQPPRLCYRQRASWALARDVENT